MPNETIDLSIVADKDVIVFDADILIKLAQHPDNLNAINAITSGATEDRYMILLTSGVRNAFEREKVNAAATVWAVHRSRLKEMRALKPLLANPGELDRLADELKGTIDELQAGVPDTIAAVEKLISNSMVVLDNENTLASAARRIREQKAPALRARKSSVNDCILWEVVRATVSIARSVVFSSDNKHDFAAVNVDERKLHPDLANELSDRSKFCFHSLPSFQEHHLKSQKVVDIPMHLPALSTCMYCGKPLDQDLIPRPSQYGGWTYQQLCRSCWTLNDTGEPYDD